mmetsp:Transcript_28042/g.44917  ORF Transcript_28042/g.44917 Transcript_28042/m.44917 type:complete len:278 (+) Transcript_28042:1573-2406(+)
MAMLTKTRNFEQLADVIQGRIGAHLGGKCILDVGCGDGKLANLIARRQNGTGLVIGIDREDACLDVARKDAKSRGINDENCRFIQFDVTKDNLCELKRETPQGAGFDIIVSTYSIAYFPREADKVRMLETWASLLRIDGCLVVLEIDGLLSNRSPLKFSAEFTQLETEYWIEHGGYDAFAGGKLERIARQVESLEVISFETWDDAELCVSGPITDEYILNAWESRWERLCVVKEFFSSSWTERKQAFFDCITSPEHKVTSKCRLITCRKKNNNLVVL